MNINELRHNRYLRILFVPFRMRALVRGSEIGLVIAGAIIGIISALVVAAIAGISQWMHQALFGLPHGERLSSASQLDWTAYIAPLAGGILMGILIWVLARWRKKPIVDPIEENTKSRIGPSPSRMGIAADATAKTQLSILRRTRNDLPKKLISPPLPIASYLKRKRFV